MRRPPLRFISRASVALAACLTLGSCGQLPAQSESVRSPIFGGTPDTTHDAVMALLDQLTATTSSACSGTTIALSGASGIFLTAAHCVVANDGMGHVTTPIKVASVADVFVVPGPDWQLSVKNGLYYGVGQIAVHPMYDGNVNSPFDIALVRFLGAATAQPVIPALAPTEDKLAVGSQIDVVGFGKTQTNDMNSTRMQVPRTIQSITSNQFLYDQTDMKGACQGDSGGPALVDTPNGTRVGGITSFGDPDCVKEGASVRVSPFVTSFIQTFISGAPKTLTCNDCSLASVAPGNTCASASAACATTGTACGAFLTCAGMCTTSTCIATCRRNNAAGAQAYDAVVACQCNACKSVCSNTVACGGTGTGITGGAGAGGTGTGTAGSSGGTFMCQDFTDPNAACQTCKQGACCSEAIACATDATCSACLNDPSSANNCVLDLSYSKMTQCLSTCPGAPCSPSSTGAAGNTGTTGTGAAGSSTGGGGCQIGAGSAPARGVSVTLLLALAIATARRRARRG
jgi:secreted trypsin-like serine protease